MQCIKTFSSYKTIALFFIISIGLWAAPNCAKALPGFSTSSLGTKQNVSISKWVYPSGNLAVTGKLYVPNNSTGKLPVVIFSHDGISGISKEHNLCSIRLAKKGYVVFSPSYRGEDASQGTIEIAKGEVDDVLNAIKWLKTVPQADTDNIVLMGASHGALISLLASARTDEIKGLIFAYGVSDIYHWWDYLKAHNKLGRDPITLRTYGNGPEARPESFAIRHGLNAVPNVNVPVLILQGALDDITPLQQARSLRDALKENGKTCSLYVYSDALHGFLVYAPYLKKGVTAKERAQAEEAWQRVFTFLNKVTK